MRAIVLASTALLCLSLPACDPPSQEGTAFGLLSGNTCRDQKGRFAKCQTCPDGSKIWVGKTCPVPPPPPPPPSGDELSPSIEGAIPIASEFDPKTGLVAIPPAGTASPDVVGAFRFVCFAGQLLRDDPIVFPGQPGKSHLHQFYGNTGANASSTYKSLRTTGQSTCALSPLNRSAYWQPAMLDGKGNVIQVDHIQIYYKRRPKSDPKCSLSSGDPGAEGNCVELPNGLKFIFGFDMVTNKAPTGSFDFICSKSGMTNSPAFKTIPEGAAYAQCTAGGRFYFRGKAPDCWDGKRLDSANHRDHVAYSILASGRRSCPSTHPLVIPGFTILGAFVIVEGDDLRLWRFASDDMHPELPHGSTFHADFFMAWDPTIKAIWHANCIDKLLSCSSGDLGNGWQMRNVLKAVPRLVAVPS